MNSMSPVGLALPSRTIVEPPQKSILNVIMCCLYVVDSILCPAIPMGDIWHFILIFKISRGIITMISFNKLLYQRSRSVSTVLLLGQAKVLNIMLLNHSVPTSSIYFHCWPMIIPCLWLDTPPLNLFQDTRSFHLSQLEPLPQISLSLTCCPPVP